MGVVLLSISAPFIRRLTERTVSQFPEPEPYDDSPAGSTALVWLGEESGTYAMHRAAKV